MILIALLLMAIVGVLHAGILSSFVPCDTWTLIAVGVVSTLWYFRPLITSPAKEKSDGRTGVEEG